MRHFSFAPLLLLTLSSAAFADGGGTVVRLSADEIAAAQAAGAVKQHAESMTDVDVVQPKRQLHGEVGFGVGSRGERFAYGTVVAPLGDNGYAAFSFADGSYGQRSR